MKLIIMRHGQASWSAATDAERALTFEGREEVLETAQKLKHLLPVDLVLASPYLRARQTGKIASEILECKLDTLESITPEGHPPSVIDELPESGTIVLASHMPLVGLLTGLLCDGNMNNGFAFPTAGAAILEMDFPAAGIASLEQRISF